MVTHPAKRGRRGGYVRLGFVLLCILSWGAACSGDRAGDGDREVIPFVYRDAEDVYYQPRPEVPVSTPLCTAATVDVELEYPRPDSREDAIVLLRAADGPCWFEYEPVVRVARAAGVVTPGPDRVRPPAPRELLWDGATMQVWLTTYGACPSDTGSEGMVELVFSDGSVEAAGTLVDPGCTNDRLERSRKWSFNAPPPPEFPANRLEVRVVEGPPRTVPDGGPIRFVVELRNLSRDEVPLEPCPPFEISYGESGNATHLISYLNCEAAPASIAPGAGVLFEMLLSIPRFMFVEGAADEPGERSSRRHVPFTGSLSWNLFPDRPSLESWIVVTVEPPRSP